MKGYFLLLFSLVIFFTSCSKNEKKILIFSKTAGFRHESIKEGKLVLMKLAAENKMIADTSENAEIFTDENLKTYSAVVFLSTTGDILNPTQQIAFERYIQAGGGFVGIHAATDTEYQWKWFAKLVGGNFAGHPKPQKATINVLDQTHEATKMLPKQWIRTDEWYNFSNLNPDVKILATLDEKSYEGGNHGAVHPLIWCHEYDGGRAFYTELGHTNESFTEDFYLKHILGAIQYAMGENKRDYSKSTSTNPPEADRFSKQVIVENLNEPMALSVTNEGVIYFCERAGKVKMYNPKEGLVKTIAKIPVDEYAGNGLMGMVVDPDYQYNNWIYFFYIDTLNSYNVSKFKVKGDQFDYTSEKKVFTFKIDHEPGAHNGGTIAFDSKGNLLISTGDNTPPWQANGYPPMDERVGRELYDAQRTAANSQDFRGKILRIKPLKNGGYEIPDNNLFSKDGKEGKPEIYAMGCRNPWKMSVDTKTDFVYWGEVGPDAGMDSTIGPRGYDEINQAKNAGNFGWPFFIADNKPYAYMNLVNNEPDFKFDPLKPINRSKNNTGLKELPSPTKAFIWYPYAASPEFPELGVAGRTACAGPVYHGEQYRNSEVKFPSYYNDKLFIYDWMRDWIMAVKMDKNGDFGNVEPVLQNLRFDHPTFMTFGPDGALYVLEYGFIWYAQNQNAKLSKITFNANNRAPVAIIEVIDSIGNAPFKVDFSAAKSYDLDRDSLRYEWSFMGNQVDSKSKNTSYTFSVAGIYKTTLTTTDSKGKSHTTSFKIIVGNTYPKIDIAVTKGSKSFYLENESIDYFVDVKDKEDGAIDRSRINTSITYLPEGSDIYPTNTASHSEKAKEKSISDNPLIAASDCKACHVYDKKSVGPSFLDVANKYKTDPNALKYLSEKIIKGGAGVWGDHAMSAHPQISLAVAKEMVQYILSLGFEETGKYTKKIASNGTISAEEFKGKKGVFYLTSSYKDKGMAGKGELESYLTLVLKNPILEARDADSTFNSTEIKSKVEGYENFYLGAMMHNSFAKFNLIDFKGIGQITLRTSSKDAKGVVEIRIGSKTGKIIGSIPIVPAGAWEKWSINSVKIDPFTAVENTYFVFKNQDAKLVDQINIDWIKFEK